MAQGRLPSLMLRKLIFDNFFNVHKLFFPKQSDLFRLGRKFVSELMRNYSSQSEKSFESVYLYIYLYIVYDR